MIEKHVQVNFRMPERLKAKLEEAASFNRRTTTSEIIYRLELSIAASGWNDVPGQNYHTDDTALKMARELVRRLEQQQ